MQIALESFQLALATHVVIRKHDENPDMRLHNRCKSQFVLHNCNSIDKMAYQVITFLWMHCFFKSNTTDGR